MALVPPPNWAGGVRAPESIAQLGLARIIAAKPRHREQGAGAQPESSARPRFMSEADVTLCTAQNRFDLGQRWVICARCRQNGVCMAEKKTVFVAFAIEDERARDLLKGQSLNTKSPFEYIDMSVKEAYDSAWKERVRTRILRSDGVIALVSKNSLNSSGQKWEIACAKEEKKKVLGVWAYSSDKTALDGVRTVAWTWDNIRDFIDSL